MRLIPVLASAAALVAVAACNRGEESASAPADNQAPAAENVANGTAAATDLAAVMHARHEHYEEMGKAMKAINNELKASSPSVGTIQRQAALIAGNGPLILTWFPEGSGPESGRETRAKAEIWSDAETFRTRANEFERVSAEFNRIAQSGNIEAVRAAVPGLGNSCKNCHDRFRAPEHD